MNPTRGGLLVAHLLLLLALAVLTVAVSAAGGASGAGKPVIGKPVTAPARPVAGKAFAVFFAVTRSDTGARMTSGRMICDPSVTGKVIQHKESFRGGTASLAFVIPANAGGKLLKVKVTIKAAGSSASRIANFRIQPAKAPVSLPVISPEQSVRAEATSSQGAIVTYPAATVRGATSVSYSRASGTMFPLGTTTVTILARNQAGTSRATFTVTVVDTTPPTIGPIANITVTAGSAGGATVNYPAITATDRVDPNVSISCSPSSGSLFPVGTTTVSCSARDASGNSATASFKVVVNPPPAPPPPPRNPPPGVVANGHYAGTTSQGQPIRFSISADGFSIATASFSFGDESCTPSGSLTGGSTFTLGSPTTIASNGSFAHSGSGSEPPGSGLIGTWSWSFQGSFASSGAVTGTAHAHDSLTSPGTLECDTGTVSWSAALAP